MTFLLRLLLSTLLGSLIGLERQWHQRTASLRTNALVAAGSAAFAAVALSSVAAGNPAPILSTIITGIGFLGAGVIFREGMNVRGINTAATLWCSAAAGTLAGIGMLSEATATAVTVIAVNLALRRVILNPGSSKKDPYSELSAIYQLNWLCSKRSEARLRALLLEQAASLHLAVQSLSSAPAGGGQLRLSAQLVMNGRDDLVIEEAVGRLGMERSVRSLQWQLLDAVNRFD